MEASKYSNPQKNNTYSTLYWDNRDLQQQIECAYIFWGFATFVFGAATCAYSIEKNNVLTGISFAATVASLSLAVASLHYMKKVSNRNVDLSVHYHREDVLPDADKEKAAAEYNDCKRPINLIAYVPDVLFRRPIAILVAH